MNLKLYQLNKNKRIFVIISVVISMIIISSIAFPNIIKKYIYGEDYDEISYSVLLNPANVNIVYSIKVPIPTNWTIINDLEKSEGNATYWQTTENRTVIQPVDIEKQLDYLVVTGMGINKLFFKYRSNQISDVYFEGLDWFNDTVDVYLETIPLNCSIDYMFAFGFYHVSPTDTTPNTGYKLWSNGTLFQNGWSQVDTGSIGW